MNYERKVNCRICNKEISWETWMLYVLTGRLCHDCYIKHGGRVKMITRKATYRIIERIKKEQRRQA